MPIVIFSNIFLLVAYVPKFLAKSKELRAVGRASSIPVLFNVNEPFLFGAPIGVLLGLGLRALPVLYLVAIIVADFIIYYPFFKV